MSQIFEEMLLRKYAPSKDELWYYKLTRPGVSVYVKSIRNIKKTMQQIIGKGTLAVLETRVPVLDGKDLLCDEQVFILLKG